MSTDRTVTFIPPLQPAPSRKGNCPDCGHIVSLNSDGRLREHFQRLMTKAGPRAGNKRCDGSHQMPEVFL